MRTYDAHKTTTEVRQGNHRLMNLRVLIVSSIAVVLVFGVLIAAYYMFQPAGV